MLCVCFRARMTNLAHARDLLSNGFGAFLRVKDLDQKRSEGSPKTHKQPVKPHRLTTCTPTHTDTLTIR
jgi:hypothetical protein